MATYRNKISGVEILTESELSGDWELVDESTKTKNSKSEEVEPTEESEVVSDKE